MKKKFSLYLLMFLTVSAFAQRNCHTTEYNNLQLIQSESFSEKQQELELLTQQYNQMLPLFNTTNQIYTIPIIVHIIYNNNTENISDEQIFSQIDSLNKDFRAQNADISTVPDVFQPYVADVGIEFCFATIDPNGNPTNGINRVQTSNSSFSYTGDDMKFTSSGGVDVWNPSDYLNIWVCDISGGILGYAQFPGGNPQTDGVVVDYEYFGSIGTAAYPYDLGRTLTHEVGHWLNLRHIWGDNYCGDDFVDDTPTQETSNGGCPNFPHVTCNNGPDGDMFMNYMDYTYDACLTMFTQGQKNRMVTALTTTRSSLLSSTVCGDQIFGCTDATQFNYDPLANTDDGSCEPYIYGCTDESQFNYDPTANTDNNSCVSFVYGCLDSSANNFDEFANTDNGSCEYNCQSVTLTITTDQWGEETSWILLNNEQQITIASISTNSYQNQTTYNYDYCLVEGCYTYSISDTYGDGIEGYNSNSNDDGYYAITDSNGNSIIQIGNTNFGYNESQDFCINFVQGCTDPIATNFDISATQDNGSCEYAVDYCEINNSTDNWQIRSNYLADTRHHPITFSNERYGFVLAGNSGSGNYLKDVHRYDSYTDTWEQLSDFPGNPTGFGYGVSNGTLAYVGFGRSSTSYNTDWWQYDIDNDVWTQLASFPADGRAHPALILVNQRVYMGLGNNSNGNLSDWWEYRIDTDEWVQHNDFPYGQRHHPFYFDIGNYAYVGFGHGNSINNTYNIYSDFYRYEHETDTWTEIAEFPAEGRVAGTQFSFDGKGYVLSGDGDNHSYMECGQFWEYDPLIDNWTQLESHPGSSRWAPGSFVINCDLYFTSGYDRQTGILHNDLYSFNLSNNCGCTDIEADNYNPNAIADDGSCSYTILGCTDSNADNFDPNASVDDGSCTYCGDFTALLLGTSDASAAGSADGSV
ncbi:MAG: M43 family zinc metalloprotease, partial [Flavobacteriales bacterium]